MVPGPIRFCVLNALCFIIWCLLRWGLERLQRLKLAFGRPIKGVVAALSRLSDV